MYAAVCLTLTSKTQCYSLHCHEIRFCLTWTSIFTKVRTPFIVTQCIDVKRNLNLTITLIIGMPSWIMANENATGEICLFTRDGLFSYIIGIFPNMNEHFQIRNSHEIGFFSPRGLELTHVTHHISKWHPDKWLPLHIVRNWWIFKKNTYKYDLN